MKRILRELIPLGGLAASCAAAVQISQLVDGDAVRDLWNYAITAATALAGVGLTGVGFWQRRGDSDLRPDDRKLLAATDLLFAHFAADDDAQEAVRVVARAVTEQRYRGRTET
jgi:hypothetical protein